MNTATKIWGGGKQQEITDILILRKHMTLPKRKKTYTILSCLIKYRYKIKV